VICRGQFEALSFTTWISFLDQGSWHPKLSIRKLLLLDSNLIERAAWAAVKFDQDLIEKTKWVRNLALRVAPRHEETLDGRKASFPLSPVWLQERHLSWRKGDRGGWRVSAESSKSTNLAPCLRPQSSNLTNLVRFIWPNLVKVRLC
jgi:hypothetical protein